MVQKLGYGTPWFLPGLRVQPGVRIGGHIYCADKGAYYDILDDVPQADADDPALTTQVGP